MVRAARLRPWLLVALVLGFLYAPVAVTVLFSFTTSPRLSLPIEGLTLDWYARAFDNPLMSAALGNSLMLAAVSAAVSGAAGTAFAFGLVRARARRVLLTLALLPAVVPLLVTGIALAVLMRAAGVPQGLMAAAAGHVLVTLPFVILTMNARLETFDFSVLEAARDLGASPARAFRDITLPLVRGAVLGAMLLATALSLDEFVVTWFNIGNAQTLPVLVWGLMRRGVDPSINAIATVLLGLILAALLAAALLGRSRSR